MSDQAASQNTTPPAETPSTPPETPYTPPPSGDWREQRQAERMARREARMQRHAGRSYGWIGGAILVLLGIIFLLQNFGVQVFINWWAIFILIPAFWAFVGAWNSYQDNGKLTRGVAGSLAVGVVLTILALVFLLNLALEVFWPVVLIIGGLALLVSALFPR
jgi:cytochrome c oxidase subunit IV